eukprot:g3196.t1
MKGAIEALEKIKEELMLVGTLSLILQLCAPACDSSDKCCRSIMGLPGQASQAICKDGYESFVTIKAMHHIHTFVFFIAVIHISMSVIVMTLGNRKVRSWAQMEKSAQDLEEGNGDIGTLHRPKRPRKCLGRWCCGCIKQWNIQPDTFQYIALRQYFITRGKDQDLPSDFDFQAFLQNSLHQSFKHMVGMSWWMWGILMLQIILKGFISDVAFGVYSALGLSLIVATKLDGITTQLTHDIFDKMDKDNSGTIEFHELREVRDHAHDFLDDVEPHFWFNSPQLLMFLMRLIVWQCATENAATVFYWYQFTPHLEACYFVNRPLIILALNSVGAILVMLHCAINIVPTFAILEHMGDHLKTHALIQHLDVDAHARRLTSKASMHASKHARKIRPLKSLSSSSHDDDDHHHHQQHVDVDKESEQHGSDEGGKVEDEEEDMHHFDEEEDAAAKMQAAIRGRKARKEIKAQHDAAAKIQAIRRGQQARADLDEGGVGLWRRKAKAVGQAKVVWF